MRVSLEIRTGPQAGRTFVLQAGQIGQVGRSSWADLALAHDASLADLHFIVECGESNCLLRDLNTPGGTLLNGTKVSVATLGDGDEIVAGETTFLVRVGTGVGPGGGAPTTSPRPAVVPPIGEPPRPSSPSPTVEEIAPGSTPVDRLLHILRGQAQPLFAVLDAARDPAILELLLGSEEEYQSLYEGEKGEELADFAPYLVRLPADSGLLESLVRQGWGQAWGIYLRCDEPFEDVRKHFRHFLMATLEDGRLVYFRFYDPRVLRTFLPTCTREVSADFFGPVACFLMEDEDAGALLKLTPRQHAAEAEVVPLSTPA